MVPGTLTVLTRLLSESQAQVVSSVQWLMLISGTCSVRRAALEGCLCVQVGTGPPGHEAGQGGFLEAGIFSVYLCLICVGATSGLESVIRGGGGVH